MYVSFYKKLKNSSPKQLYQFISQAGMYESSIYFTFSPPFDITSLILTFLECEMLSYCDFTSYFPDV